MRNLMLAVCVAWSAVLCAASTNLVPNGVHAGEGSDGIGNIALGSWAFFQASGTNAIAVGPQAAYKARGASRSIFVGDGAGRGSTNLVRCIAIGPDEMAGAANMDDTISVGGRIVIGENMMWMTPEAIRHTLYAPLFWFNGNFVLTADHQLVISCPSNVIIKAGREVFVTNAVLEGVKSCDWTPRMVVENGALQVYTNGVKAGSIPLSGN